MKHNTEVRGLKVIETPLDIAPLSTVAPQPDIKFVGATYGAPFNRPSEAFAHANAVVERDLAPVIRTMGAPAIVLTTITSDELAALRRMYDYFEDGQSYSMSKKMLQRLAQIGLLRHTGGARYQFTECGHALLSKVTKP